MRGRNANGDIGGSVKRPPNRREQALLAFRAYTELIDTATWLRNWTRGSLESFDLTAQGFQMLLLLYQQGPERTTEVARLLRCRLQNADRMARDLEKRGWVKRLNVDLPPKRANQSGPKTPGARRRTWGVGVVTLTPQGKKFMAEVFPNHAKVVRALMRALHVREQRVLIEICRKLRTGAILKLVSEIRIVEDWEEEDGAEGEQKQEADESGESENGGNTLSELLAARPAVVRSDQPRREDDLTEDDWKHLPGILERMRKYDILKAATNVDWDLPRDEEREAGHAVRMLMNVADDRERKVLEKMRRGRSDLEVVGMVREMMGEG
ncbi:MAG TPA: MarR family transcriptional regulator [Candidatus Acidoferrum sp.]|nr:MarR family transcriptional regulator [Candidatus Acidoferrum sp.]